MTKKLKKNNMKNSKLFFVLLLAFLAMQMVPTQMQSQLKPGYEYSYDNDSNPNQIGHGNRVKRVGKTVQLKAADTTMIETTVGNFNIRIYPNPTKGQLTLNIAELGRNDKIQMFLYDFIGNELAKMDFSTAENTIDMSRHVNGTYFLRVIIGEQTETFKIVKME